MRTYTEMTGNLAHAIFLDIFNCRAVHSAYLCRPSLRLSVRLYLSVCFMCVRPMRETNRRPPGAMRQRTSMPGDNGAPEFRIRTVLTPLKRLGERERKKTPPTLDPARRADMCPVLLCYERSGLYMGRPAAPLAFFKTGETKNRPGGF